MKKSLSLFLCFVAMKTCMESGSWNSYINSIIAQSKDASGKPHCDKVAIIGLDGEASWTTAEHANVLILSPQERKTIAECFKSKNFSDFMSKGVIVNRIKYQLLRVEDSKTVFAKKKDSGALTLQASKTAIVIGHTAEGCQQGYDVNKAVAVIAKYLESLNM